MQNNNKNTILSLKPLCVELNLHKLDFIPWRYYKIWNSKSLNENLVC